MTITPGATECGKHFSYSTRNHTGGVVWGCTMAVAVAAVTVALQTIHQPKSLPWIPCMLTFAPCA